MKKVKNMYLVNRPEHSNMPELPKVKKDKSLKGKFRYEGYRLMSYDATYEKTLFDVIEREIDGSRTIEIEDVKSGMRFIVTIKEGKKK